MHELGQLIQKIGRPRDLGYSTSHLRAVFNDKIGISLGRSVRETRLAQASMLLLTTKKSISTVAEETGFASLTAFSRAFSRRFGVAPKAYSQNFSSIPSESLREASSSDR